MLVLFTSGCASPLSEYEADLRARKSDVFGSWYDEAERLSGSADRSSVASKASFQQGTPTIDESSSLEDCLRHAALSNPGLESAFYAWQAAVERSPQVESLPDPRISYAYFVNEVETRVGPQQHRFMFSQPVPWFGKLELRGDAADADARAAFQRFQAARLDLHDRVSRAYFELYYLRRSIELTQENLDLLSQFEAIARQKYRVAEASHPDIIRVQVELGKLEDRLRRLRQMRSPAITQFNAALNRPSDSPAPWPDSIPNVSLDADQSQLQTWLKESNPELIALDEELTRERANSEFARKSYYPDFSIDMTYLVTDEAMNPSISESGDDAVLFGFSLSLPIWEQKNAAAVRESVARRLQIARGKDEKSNQLVAAVEQTLFEHEDAQRRIRLYRDTLVPKATESLQASFAGFQGGNVSFLDLLDTERSLLEFQLLLERARADRAQSLARLERLVGRPLPTTSEEATEVPRDNQPTNSTVNNSAKDAS